ncbi:CDR ABC transporter [Penicillium griseofulvum]|uniref:CDR ABC transporter n=1 Tax=Penicillium patulum TaxID=5078 RepID=A0A135LHW1_PENPA|nr:CDR ABC transporter [Penicillium griseofulvum]KXG48510.1 CDR ABC transporter [Penicillium griseofulvum]
MDTPSSGTTTPVDLEHGYGQIRKRLTVTFRNLNVRVTAPDAALGSTLWSEVDPRQLGGLLKRGDRPKRTILKDVAGQVKPGEMLLVLGRPGSGCTSLLRVLSNDRDSFDEVTGETNYGSMDHKAAKKFHDVHFPSLTVNRTMKFALRNKIPNERPEHLRNRKDFVQNQRDDILGSLGIGHTKKNLVGNEYIRGVSGGERKRVSLAEVLAGQSPVQMWDNPTRGLDSKSAVEFARMLRREANRNDKTIITTTYQAGNGIYDQFDKVLVLAEGCVTYYGPRHIARKYFEDLGFICPNGANIADFLTSVTVVTERTVRPGWEEKVPNTPEDFENCYQNSSICKEQMRSIVDPGKLSYEVEDLNLAVSSEKRKQHIPRNSSVYTANLWDQIAACALRQFQVIWGDKLSLFVKVGSAIIQALKRFGFYRPTAFAIANAITDIPVVMFQVTCFSLILYFMSALQMNAGKFFTFWIIVIVQTLCFVQIFRAVGAVCKQFGNASKISGLLTTVFFVYGGYLIPFHKMHVWFRWIFYLNPGAYAFEALMANEFVGRKFTCIEPDYLPYGTGYSNSASPHRGCSVLGSDDEGIIDGEKYIQEQYSYSVHHIWRSFGVLIGCWIFFIFVTSFGLELRNSQSGSSVLLYKRGSEKTHGKEEHEKSESPKKADAGALLGSVKQSTFTWKDLDYHVPFHGEKKQLLNKVFGFVQPGNLVALMGASGAGKTTLLDVLAQRKDSGEIYGSVLIDGRPVGISFQRTTGYCEQMDVHLETATVKEALDFSAVLRQPSTVSHDEKIAYVEHIIDLLELRDISEALIGVPGAGLSIEQRKRVTLGVELVAKPTLLFLDEPTSGLDGQSAFNIVRFLRKLVDGGQAVLCTIHQPSAVLFDAFDGLLLLAKGGKMTYFGETGKDSTKILDYFARNGAPCPPDANPAEHIIDVVQGGGTTDKTDWIEVWNQSEERKQALFQLDALNESSKNNSDYVEDTADFATSHWFQFKMVSKRLSIHIWRSPDYMWNKIILHIFAALFSGFTFWKIGNGTFDLQLRLFAIFNFIFVAPGCINQMQPFFLHSRDIFETREKKSKTYHWSAFIGAQTLTEIPYLIICATLYFACWYFTAGLPLEASVSGHVYLQMIFYELLYTSIGQAIAAYAPNEYFAAVMNPVVIGAGLISFCGVVVPYSLMQPFWRYWIYYLDPFNYLVGGLFGEVVWDVKVKCEPSEFVEFTAPSGQTCGQYMTDFLAAQTGYLADGNSTGTCLFCPYSEGSDYAKTFNLQEKYYSWRDVDRYHRTILHLIVCLGLLDDEAQEQEDEECPF